MRTKLYITGLGLLLAGASATTMIASGNHPAAQSEDTFEILSTTPGEGSIVKAVSAVSVTLFGNYGESVYIVNEDLASSITITKEGGESVSATGFGEMEMDYMTMNMQGSIYFPTIKDPGTYTLSIPEGVFAEGEWDDWDIIPMEGGMVNAAYTATFTIDPNAKSLLDDYQFVPESGSVVKGLDDLKLIFPNVPIFGIYYSEDDVEITATCGDKNYFGYANQDWDSEEEYATMRFSFVDTETGEWAEWTPGTWDIYLGEGAFIYNGDASPEIKAEFTILAPSEEKMETMFTFPADGSTIKETSSLKLYYPVTDPEASINVDEMQMNYLEVEKTGGWYYGMSQIGEPELVMNDMYLMIPVEFTRPLAVSNNEETADFTITIPEGLFYQTKYNEETGSFEAFEGYQINAEQTFHITVDANASALLEDYTLTPEANSSVSSLETVSIVFNNVPSYIAINHYGLEDITLVNGDKEYVGMANVMDPARQNAFDITFYDENGEEAVIEGGTYTLTIPEGYFTLDGEKNPEIKSEYNVSPAVLTPAPGSTITELDFKLEFPNAKTVEFVGAPYMVTFGSNSAGIPSYNVEKVADAAVPTFMLTAPEDALVGVGYNVLKIEEGAFLIDGAEGDTEGNSPFIQGMYYYEKEISQDYLPEPNNINNEVVCQSWGYTVGFVFEDGVNPKITSYDGVEVKFDDTVLRLGSEEACYNGEADYSSDVMENIVSFFIVNPEYHKEGKISVTLKGSSYTLSGNPGFDVSHTWNVVMPQEYDVVLEPVGGETQENALKVTGFEDFTITFNNAEKAEVYRASGISLNKLDYSVFATPEAVAVEDADVPTFKLVFDENDTASFTDGLYRLQIYFDTFTVDDVMTWPSDYQTLEYYYNLDTTGDSVESVAIDANSKITVVSADGKVIFNNKPANCLENLENGVYVVNGKKMVVKK